jgi:hypothetical protein
MHGMLKEQQVYTIQQGRNSCAYSTLRQVFFRYFIQHCFICHPADPTVSEDAGIELMTVATSALAVRRSNHLAIDIIHTRLDLIHRARSHPQVNQNYSRRKPKIFVYYNEQLIILYMYFTYCTYCRDAS